MRLLGEVLEAAAKDGDALLDHADGAVAALNLYRFLLLREVSRRGDRTC